MLDFISTSMWRRETVFYHLSYHFFLKETNSRDLVCTGMSVFLFWIYRIELLGLTLVFLTFLGRDCDMVMLSSEAVLLTFSCSARVRFQKFAWQLTSFVDIACSQRGGWQVCLPHQVLNESFTTVQLCSVIEVCWHLSSAPKIARMFLNQKFLE